MAGALTQRPAARVSLAFAAARVWIARSRARQWAHFAALPLAGADPSRPAREALPSLARGVLVASLVLAYGYLLNAAEDRGMDADARKNPLLDRAAPASVRGALVVLLAGALTGAATGPRVAFACAALSLVCGWAYSAGPRLKAVPLVGTALNAGAFGPLLFVGLARDALPAGLLPLAALFVALLLQNQLLHEAADADEDRRGALRTTFLALGARATVALLVACGIAASLLVARIVPGASAWVALAVAVLVFVVAFPLAMARGAQDPARMARVRRLQRGASLATGVLAFAAQWLR